MKGQISSPQDRWEIFLFYPVMKKGNYLTVHLFFREMWFIDCLCNYSQQPLPGKKFREAYMLHMVTQSTGYNARLHQPPRSSSRIQENSPGTQYTVSFHLNVHLPSMVKVLELSAALQRGMSLVKLLLPSCAPG